MHLDDVSGNESAVIDSSFEALGKCMLQLLGVDR